MCDDSELPLRAELQARIGLMPKVHVRQLGEQPVLYSQVSSLSEITRLVRAARTLGLRVRSGAGVDCLVADELDVIVDTDGIADEERIASAQRAGQRLVVVKPGVTVREFNEFCLSHDVCLPACPELPAASLVDLATTGCSGHSPGQPAVSDFLDEIRIVDADGRLRVYRNFTEEELDSLSLDARQREEKRRLFAGAQCHLGLFGVVYDATFRVEKNYTVSISSDFRPLEETLLDGEALRAMAAANQSVSLYWFPFNSVRGPDDPLPPGTTPAPTETAASSSALCPDDDDEAYEADNDEQENEEEQQDQDEQVEREEQEEREAVDQDEDEEEEEDNEREADDVQEEQQDQEEEEDNEREADDEQEQEQQEQEQQDQEEEEDAAEADEDEEYLGGSTPAARTPPPELYSLEDWTPQRDEVFCRFMNPCPTLSQAKVEFDLISPEFVDADTGSLLAEGAAVIDVLRRTHRRHRQEQPSHSQRHQHVSWGANWVRATTYPRRLSTVEYVLDAGDDFGAAVRSVAMVTERVNEYKGSGQFPLNCCLCVSFSGASSALMAPSHAAHPDRGGSGTTCSLRVLLFPEAPDGDRSAFEEFVNDLEMDLRCVPGARPHWATNWAFVEGTHAMLRKVYDQDLGEFKAMIREKLVDLDGVFLNRHLAKVVESDEFHCQQRYSLKNRQTKDKLAARADD